MKLRNAGFELGTTDYWDAIIGSDFSVDDSIVSRGSYSGKIKSDGSGQLGIRHRDYIETEQYDIIHVGCDVYPHDDAVGYIRVYRYDENYNEIGYDALSLVVTGGEWNTLEYDSIVPYGCKYIRPAIVLYFLDANTYSYVDNLYLKILTPINTFFRLTELYNSGSSSITSSGSSSANRKFMVGLREYYAHLHAEWNGSDSDETLEVKIHEVSPINGRDVVVGSFSKVTASDVDERIKLTNCSGYGLYAEWTLNGTTPSWNYVEIEVWGVR